MFTRTTILTGLLFTALTGAAMAEATAPVTTAATTTTTTATTAAVTTPPAKKIPGDTDGDGRLSKAEFLAVYEKRFDKTDANKDGFVTHEERAAEAVAKASAKKASATVGGSVTTEGEKPSFLRRLFN